MNFVLVPSQKTLEASVRNRAGHKGDHYPQPIASEIDDKWQLISFPATLATTEDRSADILYCVYFALLRKQLFKKQHVLPYSKGAIHTP